MNQTRLVPMLDSIAATWIDNLNINFSKDTLTLHLKYDPQHDTVDLNLVFEEVSAFYFLDEKNNAIENVDVARETISSIIYYPSGFGEFVSIEVAEEDGEEYVSIAKPNFLIKMVEKSLLVEAKCVTINEKRFRIGYPMN